MSRVKQWITFALAVIMTVNLLPTSLLIQEAKAANVGEEPQVLFTENFDGWIANTNSGVVSTRTTTKNFVWNNADPDNAPVKWSMLLEDKNGDAKESAAAKFIYHKTGGYDGGSYLELATSGDGGRAGISCKLSSSDYAKFVEGKTYVLRLWVKASQVNDINLRVNTVFLTSGNKTTGAEVSNGSQWERGWVQVEHEFVFSKERGSMTLNIGMNNHATSGSLYIDGITISEQDTRKINFSKEDIYIMPGEKEKISYTLENVSANSTVIFSSDNPSIATVNSKGEITGVSMGTAVITASIKDSTVKAKCEVHVAPALLVEESFENWEKNNNTGKVSNDTKTLVWNGAAPADDSPWSGFTNMGTSFYGNVPNAIDGKYSVAITPNFVDAKAGITYTMPSDIYELMEEGEEYAIRVWFKKTEEGVFSGRIQALCLKSGNPQTLPALEEEWTEVEHRFIFSRAKGSMGVNLGVYNVTESGTCFIDKMTIEKVLEVDTVTLNKTNIYLKTGNTFKLDYQLFPDNTSSTVSFHSANEEIATVDANGTITAHKTGQTTITVVAAKGNRKAECQINVVNEIVNAQSVKIDKGTLSLNPGGQQMLSAVFTPAETSDKSVTWTSSNPSVATVDSQGLVSAYAVGTAVINVTAGNLTASCRVTVSDAGGFASVNKALKVQFGQKTSIKLKDYLAGSSYRLVKEPQHGKLLLNTATGEMEYTSYTWPIDKANGEFEDKEYQDYVLVAVTNAAGKTALITLNITVGKFGELFDWKNIHKMNLFFSQEDLNAINAEIVNDPSGERATLFTNFLKLADNDLNKKPVAYDAPDDEYNEDGTLLKQDVSHTNLEQRATGISMETYVIAYLLTKNMKGYEAKNTAYLNKVIEYAEAALSYPFWGTRSYVNEDLAAGHLLIGMSLAYHWMKEELSKVTCDHMLGTDSSWNNWTVKTTKNMPMLKAMEERLWYVGRAMYNGNITTTWHVQNHNFVRMAGQIAVAIALAPTADTAKEQQEIVNWAGMVLWRNGTGMNAMMPDGTSQEGLSYWEYGAIRALQASLMAEEAFGIDLLELTQAFRNSDEWIAYNMLPKDHWTSSESALHFSDSSGSHFSGPSDILRILAAKYQDQEAQWLAQQVEQAGIDVDSTIWTGVVFADTTLKATAMTNDSIAHFEDMDIVISRSDWSGNEDIVAIKTGIPTGKNMMEMYQNGTYLGDPESGHSHPDANHITIYANGEYLLRDDKGDVTPKASNHNTLLINEKGQLGEGSNYIQESAFFDKTDFPHIQKVVSCDAYDYIIGNATEAYAESLGLAKFERHIIYIKAEKVLLVVDDIQTYNEEELELRWFPQSKTVVYSGGTFTMKSDKNTMNFFPFTANVETVFEDVTVYGSSGGTAPEEAFRQIYTGTNWQNAVAFSWQDAGLEPHYVSYEGGNDGVHRFCFDGQIYSLNISTAEVTITSGTIMNPNLESGSDDSTLSTVLVNGTVFVGFNPKVTEYTIDRWWKTYELDFQCFANSYGAQVSIQQEKDKITVTCTSRDGTNSTVYTFMLTNSKNILGIVDVKTSMERYGYDPKWTYDGVITLNNNGKYWTIETDSSGQVSLIYDMKNLVNITQIDLAIQNSKSYNYYYDLCISEDGETWTELKTAAIFEKTEAISLNNHATRTIFEFGSEKARYVKIVLRGRSSDESMNYIDKSAWCGVQEITVYGTEYHEHNMQWAPAKEPTCTEPGVSAGMKCTLCDYYETEPTIYPALGHDKKDLPAIPSTCTDPGLTAGKICSRCNQELWPRHEIKPLGGSHKWGQWAFDGLSRTHTCQTCGATETSSLVPVIVTVVAVVLVGAGGAVTAYILLRRKKRKEQLKDEAEM